MKKIYFSKGKLTDFMAAKIFFVAYILFTLFSSFFNLYRSNEISPENNIHLKGEVVLYDKSVIEVTPSTDNSNLINLKGGALIYNGNSSEKQGAEEVLAKPTKITKPAKKKNIIKASKASVRKNYNTQKASAYFTGNNSNLLINSLLIKNNICFALPQNPSSKHAVSNSINTKNIQQFPKEQKSKNYYFSKGKSNSFFQTYFSRPPPAYLF